MKRSALIALIVVVLAIAGAAAFFFLPAPLEQVQASAAQPSGPALIEKGRYLATAGDCVACHTAPGGKPFAGGLAFKLPFGTIYSSNITPDRRFGIGSWSDAEFVRAMHHGVGKDGKDLYPAFPYAAYARMSTDDALAIRAYLATLGPVAQATPANDLSFPFNQRWLMRGWKLLFMPKRPMAPEPAQSAEWNRGAYLAQAFAHCGECHTPRNLLYGLKQSDRFAGATTQGWTAYNITASKSDGIGNWSVDDLAHYLATGTSATGSVASGPMAEAIALSLSHLTPADIRAIATYVKSTPARPGEAIAMNPPALAHSTAYSPAPGEAKDHPLGLRIFEGSCASCHGWNGAGLQDPYAALKGKRSVNEAAGTNLVQVVLHGAQVKTLGGTIMMPSFARAYSDAEIAAVANYVVAHFGNKTGTVTPADVAKARLAGD